MYYLVLVDMIGYDSSLYFTLFVNNLRTSSRFVGNYIAELFCQTVYYSIVTKGFLFIKNINL